MVGIARLTLGNCPHVVKCEIILALPVSDGNPVAKDKDSPLINNSLEEDETGFLTEGNIFRTRNNLTVFFIELMT